MKQIKNKNIFILFFSLLIVSLATSWIYSITTISKKALEKKEKIQEAENTKNESKEAVTTLVTKSIKETGENTVPKPQKTPAPPPPRDTSKDASQENLKKIKPEEILEYIHELGKAVGLSAVVTFLKEECPKEKITEIIKTFINKNDYEFTREQKLKTILELGKHYKKDKVIQKQIFDIIAEHKNIEEGIVPLLFLTVEIGQQDIIPDLLAWYKGQKRPQVKKLAKQTLQYAAKNDYDIALKKLHQSGVTIDKTHATELLWDLVKADAGAKSIKFLKSLGADLDAYDPNSKYTILIQAIKNKNSGVIKELIRLGTDVTKPSTDKTIGYPLQIARELDLVDIEELLRSKGARD